MKAGKFDWVKSWKTFKIANNVTVGAGCSFYHRNTMVSVQDILLTQV